MHCWSIHMCVCGGKRDLTFFFSYWLIAFDSFLDRLRYTCVCVDKFYLRAFSHWYGNFIRLFIELNLKKWEKMNRNHLQTTNIWHYYQPTNVSFWNKSIISCWTHSIGSTALYCMYYVELNERISTILILDIAKKRKDFYYWCS